MTLFLWYLKYYAYYFKSLSVVIHRKSEFSPNSTKWKFAFTVSLQMNMEGGGPPFSSFSPSRFLSAFFHSAFPHSLNAGTQPRLLPIEIFLEGGGK
jgi:hypothetical protein